MITEKELEKRICTCREMLGYIKTLDTHYLDCPAFDLSRLISTTRQRVFQDVLDCMPEESKHMKYFSADVREFVKELREAIIALQYQ